MEGNKDNSKEISSDSASDYGEIKSTQRKRAFIPEDESSYYHASNDIKKSKSSSLENSEKFQPLYRIDDMTISLSFGSSEIHYSPSIQEFSKIFLLLKSSEMSTNFSKFLSKIQEELEQNVVFPLLELPEGPIINILSFLSINTLLDFSTCSSMCKKLAHNNTIWRNLFVRDFPEISHVREPLQQPIDSDE